MDSEHSLTRGLRVQRIFLFCLSLSLSVVRHSFAHSMEVSSMMGACRSEQRGLLCAVLGPAEIFQKSSSEDL